MRKNKGIVVIILILALVAGLGMSCVNILNATTAKKDNGLILGLDLSGGVSITYKIVNENPSATDIADTIAKMEERADWMYEKANRIAEHRDKLRNQKEVERKMRKEAIKQKEEMIRMLKEQSLFEVKQKIETKKEKLRKEDEEFQKKIREIQLQRQFLQLGRAAVEAKAFKQIEDGLERKINDRQNQDLVNQQKQEEVNVSSYYIV